MWGWCCFFCWSFFNLFFCLLESYVIFSLLAGMTTLKFCELRVKKTQRLGWVLDLVSYVLQGKLFLAWCLRLVNMFL